MNLVLNSTIGFASTKENRLKSTTLSRVCDRISKGDNGLSDKIDALHQLEGNAYEEAKARLPVFTISGVFKGRKTAPNLVEHTGLAIIDFDKVDDIDSLIAECKADPHTVVCFRSPSYTGLKVIAYTDDPPEHKHHKDLWKAVAKHYSKYSEVDMSGSNINRLCYFSYDPEIYTNADAKPIQWTPQKPSETPTDAHRYNVDIEALDYIDADDRDDWVRIGAACKRSGVGFDVWHAWSQKSGKYDSLEDCKRVWDSLQTNIESPATWGTVVYLAQKKGYKPQKRRSRPVRDVVEALCRNAGSVISIYGQPELYIKLNGVYCKDEGGYIHNAIAEELGYGNDSPHAIEQVKREIRGGRRVPKPELLFHPNHFNFKNGFLNAKAPFTSELVPHNESQIQSIRQIPYNFNLDAECPLMDNFVSEIVCPEDVVRIWTMIGQCLHAKTRFQNCWILHGKSAGNGKGTLVKIMQAILTPLNYSSESFKRLCEDRWSTIRLLGKTANLSNEIGEGMIYNTEEFRRITGYDEVRGENKNQPPIDFHPFATLVFSCNEFPNIKNINKGMRRRLQRIEFPYSFYGRENERDQDELVSEIACEAEGIIVKALRIFQESVDNNALPYSESQEQWLDIAESDSNPEIEFIREYLYYGEGETIKRAEIGKAFLESIRSKALRPPNRFYEAIQTVFKDEFELGKITFDNNSRCYTGLYSTFKSEADPNEGMHF